MLGHSEKALWGSCCFFLFFFTTFSNERGKLSKLCLSNAHTHTHTRNEIDEEVPRRWEGGLRGGEEARIESYLFHHLPFFLFSVVLIQKLQFLAAASSLLSDPAFYNSSPSTSAEGWFINPWLLICCYGWCGSQEPQSKNIEGVYQGSSSFLHIKWAYGWLRTCPVCITASVSAGISSMLLAWPRISGSSVQVFLYGVDKR